jgi:hypothetical protein
MVVKIPDHLKSTHDMLRRAYPNGFDRNDYMALLYVLDEHMSDRNLSLIVSLFLDKHYTVVSNDHAKAMTVLKPGKEDIERLIHRLKSGGFESWCKEE